MGEDGLKEMIREGNREKRMEGGELLSHRDGRCRWIWIGVGGEMNSQCRTRDEICGCGHGSMVVIDYCPVAALFFVCFVFLFIFVWLFVLYYVKIFFFLFFQLRFFFFFIICHSPFVLPSVLILLFVCGPVWCLFVCKARTSTSSKPRISTIVSD